MNKPRFFHDPEIWIRDIYLGAFEKYDTYFEDKGNAFTVLLICRFGNGESDYITDLTGRYRNPEAYPDDECHRSRDESLAMEFALKMYDLYKCDDPSVSPNARV